MISLQHVTKVYRNGTTALEDVTVEVEKGEFVFIVGQSGSGKSTFIRLLLKEEEATKGEIYVAGKNLAKLTTWKVPHLRRNIGTVFQDFKLLQDKTVFENVAFALEVIGKPKHVIDQRVPEILELVGLGDKLNNFPDELSGGEQQRVSIARVREPAARAARRRADREPRPVDVGGDHAPARQGQPDRDHGVHGHARPGDRGRDAPARDRARQGQGHPRPGARGVQLVPRFEYLFRETTSGLRRNGLVAFAAISTTFIALFLFGLSLLISRQVSLMIEATTGNVEVAVYLTDPVNPDTVSSLSQTLTELPVVANVDYETKQEACERFQVLFAEQEALVDNVDCEALPASLRVKMEDPEQYSQVAAVLEGQPGIDQIVDQSAFLDRLFAVTRVFRVGVLLVAFVMLVSASILIANTVRMGLFARRKEIGIMKLVGATNWRIRLPFLVEGLFESLIGAIAAILFLFAIKVAFIEPLNESVQFIPWIVNKDLIAIIPILLVAGALVALVAGLVGMRRFLDV